MWPSFSVPRNCVDWWSGCYKCVVGSSYYHLKAQLLCWMKSWILPSANPLTRRWQHSSWGICQFFYFLFIMLSGSYLCLFLSFFASFCHSLLLPVSEVCLSLLTTMYCCTFEKGWVGRGFVLYWYESPSVAIACETLHVCTLCIWRC